MLIQKIAKKTMIFILVNCVIWYGCKDKIDLPDQPISSYDKVYMPEATNNPITLVSG